MRSRRWFYPRVTRCFGSGEIAQPYGPQDQLSGEPYGIDYRECPGCPDCRGVWVANEDQRRAA